MVKDSVIMTLQKVAVSRHPILRQPLFVWLVYSGPVCPSQSNHPIHTNKLPITDQTSIYRTLSHHISIPASLLQAMGSKQNYSTLTACPNPPLTIQLTLRPTSSLTLLLFQATLILSILDPHTTCTITAQCLIHLCFVLFCLNGPELLSLIHHSEGHPFLNSSHQKRTKPSWPCVGS